MMMSTSSEMFAVCMCVNEVLNVKLEFQVNTKMLAKKIGITKGKEVLQENFRP